MATNYPGAKQTFSDPSGTSLLTSPDHAGLHTDMNDTVEAIQDKLGVGSGTPTANRLLIGSGNGTASWGTAINNINIGTILQGSDATGDIWYRNSSGVFTRLAIGSNGQFLTTNGTTPSWGAVSADGWIDDSSAAVVYVSGTSLRITGDVSTKYQKGARIKLTQGGTVEYFVSLGNAVASGSTTVNLFGDSGTPLANVAIGTLNYSYQDRPQNYPSTFNWGGTVGAESGAITSGTVTHKVRVFGKTVLDSGIITITNNNTGTTALDIGLPITADAASYTINGFKVTTGEAIAGYINGTVTGKIKTYNNAYPGGGTTVNYFFTSYDF